MNCSRRRRGIGKMPIVFAAVVTGVFLTCASVNAYLFDGMNLTEYQNPDNGNWYMYVDQSNIAWPTALNKSNNDPNYHLATIQSLEENDFVWGMVETYGDLSNNREYWLGGFYNDGSIQSEGAGWYWVEGPGYMVQDGPKFWNGTGPYSNITEQSAGDIGRYTNWQTGPRPWEPSVSVFEPSGDSIYLAMYSLGGDVPGGDPGDNIFNHFGWWNDESQTQNIDGYILESIAGYNPVPVPGALVLFASGLLAVMGLKRRRQG